MQDRNAQLERDVQRYQERKRVEKEVSISIRSIVTAC
jgi:hypothetical protein